jgi:hypothetical protein
MLLQSTDRYSTLPVVSAINQNQALVGEDKHVALKPISMARPGARSTPYSACSRWVAWCRHCPDQEKNPKTK